MGTEFEKDGRRIPSTLIRRLAFLATDIGLLLALLNANQVRELSDQTDTRSWVVSGTIPLDDYGCGEIELNAADRTDRVSEQRLFQLVNQERIAIGLSPLRWSEKLAEAARRHSDDMWQRHYFGHFNPEGQSPSDGLAAAGIFFSYAGENLALAPNLERAHKGLMESPGHRMNILDPKFEHLGVGAIPCGTNKTMFAQEFAENLTY